MGPMKSHFEQYKIMPDESMVSILLVGKDSPD